MKYFITIVLSLIFSIEITLAGTSGSAACPFLSIKPDARSAAMGGAVTAIIDDVNAVHWNPSALMYAKGLQGTFTYQIGLFDTSYNYAAGSYNAGNIGSFGVNAKIVSLPDIDNEYNSEGDLISLSKIESSDLSFGISYARGIVSQLYGGLTVKYISEKLAGVEGKGFAFDIGGLYQLNEKINIAVVQNNIGSKIDYNGIKYSLPASTHIGIGYKLKYIKPIFNHLEKINIGSSLNIPVDNKINFGIGSEFIFGHFIQNIESAIRLGINYPKDEGFISCLSFGAGMSYKIFTIDYSFIRNGSDIGSTHRLTLLLKSNI